VAAGAPRERGLGRAPEACLLAWEGGGDAGGEAGALGAGARLGAGPALAAEGAEEVDHGDGEEVDSCVRRRGSAMVAGDQSAVVIRGRDRAGAQRGPFMVRERFRGVRGLESVSRVRRVVGML
jgi:hypothetical protein